MQYAPSVTVTPVVDIAADTMTTTEDVPVTLNLLTNDTFENADKAVTTFTQGANGTVSVTAAGIATYTPADNFYGSDSFTYTVTSGGVEETITVTVNVSAENDPTTIGGDLDGTGAEDGGAEGGGGGDSRGGAHHPAARRLLRVRLLRGF